MFIGPVEDLARANVADYERRISRLLLEREAKAAACAALPPRIELRPRRHSWFGIWRPQISPR